LFVKFSTRKITMFSTDNLAAVPLLEKKARAETLFGFLASAEKAASSAKPLPDWLKGNPKGAWDSSLLGRNLVSSLDVQARKWLLSCVMCSADQGFEDIEWLIAQFLLLDHAKARYINVRHPSLRMWMWLRLGIAAEEDGDATLQARYNSLKVLDPDSFYAIGALAVRSEASTREAERVISPVGARVEEEDEVSSYSSNSDQSTSSRASVTKTGPQKKRKAKQPKAKSTSSAQTSESSMRPTNGLEVDQVTEGPRVKPKTTKAAQLAAANRALAESEAALALAAAEAEAERRTLLDRIKALESSETGEGNHLGLPLSPAYSFTDRATAHSTRVSSRLLVSPAPPRRCS
jgi:hypothetical protein